MDSVTFASAIAVVFCLLTIVLNHANLQITQVSYTLLFHKQVIQKLSTLQI